MEKNIYHVKRAIIVLAAGESKRMKASFSKIFQKLANLELIGHVFKNIYNFGYDTLSVVINPESDAKKIEDIAKKQQCHDIILSIQKNAYGTADAVRAAQIKYDDYDEILVIFADTPFVDSDILHHMHHKLQQDKHDAMLLGFHHMGQHPYGRLSVNNNDIVSHIVEYKDCDDVLKQQTLCNSGVMLTTGKAMAAFLPHINNQNTSGEYYLTDLPKIITKHGGHCAYILCDEDKALGIDHATALARAHDIIYDKYREYWLHAGVRMLDPKTVYFSHDTQLGYDCLLEPHVFFGENVIIGDHVTVRAFSHIEGANIGHHCKIGPFARLRPDTVCMGHNHIGNFVEIKKSTLHDGVKAGHLSYLGDADIGDNTNIGAGTITCNYDGHTKHKTIIGKDTFIGSNSSLVAPLHIGHGSIIGAGATITKDVGNDKVAFRKSQQIEKNKLNKE